MTSHYTAKAKQPGLLDILKKDRPFLVLCVVALLYTLSTGMLWFVLPTMALSITDDYVIIGLLVTIPYLVAAIAAIPLGSISDYIGRKKVIIVGLILIIPLTLLMNIATSPFMFVLLGFTLGFSMQLINSPARAYVMDIAKKGVTAEYFGVFMGMASLGLAIGPLIAGFLLELQPSNYLLISIAYFIFGVASLLLFIRLPETVRDIKTIKYGLSFLFRNDKLFFGGIQEYKKLRALGIAILFFTLLLTLVDGLIWTMEPLYYDSLNLDPGMGGLILFLFVFPLVVFNIVAGILADKYGMLKILTFGLVLAGIFLILFGTTSDVLILLVSALISTIGIAFVWPSLSGIITDISVDKKRGSVSGVWNAVMGLGYIIAPFFGGIVAQMTQSVGFVFTIVGITLLLAIIPAILLQRKLA